MYLPHDLDLLQNVVGSSLAYDTPFHQVSLKSGQLFLVILQQIISPGGPDDRNQHRGLLDQGTQPSSEELPELLHSWLQGLLHISVLPVL